MPNGLLSYVRGALVLGLVLLMAAASSGAFGQLRQFAQSSVDVASQQLVGAMLVPVAVADNHDNEDGDNADNDEDADNGDNIDDPFAIAADNGDNSGSDNSDNGGSDNGDNGDEFGIAAADNGNNSGSDNGAVAPAPAAPAAQPAAAPGPPASTTEASGTSTGGDIVIALPADHVVVKVFSWMPAGIMITIRLVDPSTVPAPPGRRVGDLIFRMQARGSGGQTLTVLPAEVNLSATYADQDIVGLSEQNVTLYWLDPSTNQWTPAPKLATDPATNYVSASVTAVGTYAVSVP